MALSQVLAPQLQQSLVLLQAPTLELKSLVEQELEQNPCLEETATPEVNQEEGTTWEGETTQVNDSSTSSEAANEDRNSTTETQERETEDEFQKEFEQLAQLDQDWRDTWAQSSGASRYSGEDEEKRQYLFDSITSSTSLHEQLMDQLRLSDYPIEDRPIAELILGNIDERGYLTSTIDELAVSTNVPAEKIHGALRLIQSFDPPGVGARDLRECLLLQLERDHRTDSFEYLMIRDHMEALGKRRFPEIARALGGSLDDVQDAAKRIAQLDPRPGRAYSDEVNQYVVPEVFVRWENGDYVVTTNNEYVPHLRISNTYKDLMAQAQSSPEVRDYIREKIRAGKFLIKSIHQRQQTILNIAKEIVSRQRDFLDNGISHLRPMTMVQVAEAVGVHETTVSRAVSGKYMETPQGLYEMKFFFTSGITTSSGVGMSNKSIKDKIADMIKREDPLKPLSDDEIVRQLQQQDIKIARRTVAKYRSELNILPSNLRRVY